MGQYDKQAKDFLKHTNTELTIELEGIEIPVWSNDARYTFNCLLTRGKINYEFKYYSGLASSKEIPKPSDYAVLACLRDDETTSLAEFIDTQGYDNMLEIQKYIAIFDEVVVQEKALRQLFNSEEISLLNDIG